MTEISTISKGPKLAWEDTRHLEDEDSFTIINPQPASDYTKLVHESDSESNQGKQQGSTDGYPWVFALMSTNLMTALVVGGLTFTATYIIVNHMHKSGIISFI